MQEPFHNKNILITGGAGFIGANLAILLPNATITILDNFAENTGANKNHVNKKYKLINTDIRDPQLSEKLETYDYVFHLAGQLGHLYSVQNPQEDFDINVNGTINLLEALRKKSPNATIVYAGTRNQYGKIEKTPVREDHPCNPSDPNSISKQTAEDYLFFYNKTHNMKTTSLRLTNTYGPRSHIKTNTQGFIGWFINLAIHDKEITLYGDGQQQRDILYVEDACKAMLQAAIMPKAIGQAFNIASGIGTTLKEIAQCIIKEIGSGKITYIPYPEENKKIEIGNFIADINKAKSILTWQPTKTITQGIKETIQFYKKNKEKYL